MGTWNAEVPLWEHCPPLPCVRRALTRKRRDGDAAKSGGGDHHRGMQNVWGLSVTGRRMIVMLVINADWDDHQTTARRQRQRVTPKREPRRMLAASRWQNVTPDFATDGKGQ